MKKFNEIIGVLEHATNTINEAMAATITQLYVYTDDHCHQVLVKALGNEHPIVDNDRTRDAKNAAVDLIRRIYGMSASEAVQWLESLDVFVYSPELNVFAWPTSDEYDEDANWTVYRADVKRI